MLNSENQSKSWKWASDGCPVICCWVTKDPSFTSWQRHCRARQQSQPAPLDAGRGHLGVFTLKTWTAQDSHPHTPGRLGSTEIGVLHMASLTDTRVIPASSVVAPSFAPRHGERAANFLTPRPHNFCHFLLVTKPLSRCWAENPWPPWICHNEHQSFSEMCPAESSPSDSPPQRKHG